MTLQISISQQRLLEEMLFNSSFAKDMSKHPSHACIGDWLPHEDGAKVLELGCGPGKYVAMLCSLGFKVVGVDPFEFPSWETLRKSPSAELHSGVFAEQLPFTDGYFDHAICLGAILYFDLPQVALSELHRVLKPGAKVVLKTINKSNLYTKRTGKNLDPASKNLFEMEDLIQRVESVGFNVNTFFSYGFWPPILTNFWWYLVCVWFPICLQDWLSKQTPPALRVTQIIFATRL